MSFLDSIIDTRANTVNPVHPRDPVLADWFGGRETVTGVKMNQTDALTVSPWYAGVTLLSDTVGSMPAILYRRNDGGRERAADHPLYPILHDRPNPWMTSMSFFETSMLHLLGWGNSFAMIERNNRGEVTALWPMAPGRIRIQIFNNRLWYYHTPVDGAEQQIRQEDMLHVRALSSDGIVGYSPVDLLRESLGLCVAEQEYRARFFKNDARPGGIVEYPGTLSDKAYERYKKDWQETYGGLGNKFRLGFLEQGMKYHDTAFTPQAAEFIEGRKFQVEEVARILRIPLILLQSTEKSTSWGTGIEQFLLAYVTFTIKPWLVRFEKQAATTLLTEPERRIYYVEFLIDALQRADSKTRAETMQIWRRNGIINANQWLEMENRNPIGAQGDVYTIEGNMTRLDQVGQANQPKANDGQAA